MLRGSPTERQRNSFDAKPSKEISNFEKKKGENQYQNKNHFSKRGRKIPSTPLSAPQKVKIHF
jgi:hypothetical protein